MAPSTREAPEESSSTTCIALPMGGGRGRRWGCAIAMLTRSCARRKVRCWPDPGNQLKDCTAPRTTATTGNSSSKSERERFSKRRAARCTRARWMTMPVIIITKYTVPCIALLTTVHLGPKRTCKTPRRSRSPPAGARSSPPIERKSCAPPTTAIRGPSSTKLRRGFARCRRPRTATCLPAPARACCDLPTEATRGAR